MANTYYDSELTAEEIEEVLEAINGILNPANNGKVLAISNGKFEARSVQWGSEAVLEPLSVTENGDYTPEAGVDGFDEVHVSVPNSYSASDEGKVVSNGALVAQTARASQITQNGTYDTTLNNQVVVNVSGGSGGTFFQITYYDYDGINILQKEYVPPNGNGTFTMYDWTYSIHSQAVAGILTGITADTVVYATDNNFRFMPYPKIMVDAAGTILSTNSGVRSPVIKTNNGYAAGIIFRNCFGTMYGGNWCGVILLSDISDNIRMTVPDTGDVKSVNVHGHTIYYGFASTNLSYGGAIDVTNPCQLLEISDTQLTGNVNDTINANVMALLLYAVGVSI